MKKLLHIVATPRGNESRTLQMSQVFLESFKAGHPGWVLEKLDLFKATLPPLTVERVSGKYTLLSGKALSGNLQETWHAVVHHIEKFLSADGYLISVPMWNFSIPYILKQYLDIIVQPTYLFRYTATGVEGLVKGRKMVIITSRGGDYSLSETRSLDFQEPYLKAIFNFVGISDIVFLNGQPMDALGPEVRNQKIEEAKIKAQNLAKEF